MVDTTLVIENHANTRFIKTTGQQTLQGWLQKMLMQPAGSTDPKRVYNMFDDCPVYANADAWDSSATYLGDDKQVVTYEFSGNYFLTINHIQAQAASILHRMRMGKEIPDYKASAWSSCFLFRLVKYFEEGFYNRKFPYIKEDGTAPSNKQAWATEYSWHNTGTLGVNKVHFGKMAVIFYMFGLQYRHKHPNMPESLNGNNETVRKRQILLKVCRYAIAFPFLYIFGLLNTSRAMYNMGIAGRITISDKLNKFMTSNIIPDIYEKFMKEGKLDILEGELHEDDEGTEVGHQVWLADWLKFTYLDTTAIDALKIWTLINKDFIVPEEMLDLGRNLWGISPSGFKDTDHFFCFLFGADVDGLADHNDLDEVQFGYDLILGLTYLEKYTKYIDELYTGVQEYAHWTFTSEKDKTNVIADFQKCLTKFSFASNTKGLCNATLYKPLRRNFSSSSFQTIETAGKPITMYPPDLCGIFSTNTYQYTNTSVPHMLGWMFSWDIFTETDYFECRANMTLEELKWDLILQMLFAIKASDYDSVSKCTHKSFRFVEFIDIQEDRGGKEKIQCLAYATYAEPRFENTFTVLSVSYDNINQLYGYFVQTDQDTNQKLISDSRIPKDRTEPYTCLKNIHLKDQVLSFIDSVIGQRTADTKPGEKAPTKTPTAEIPTSAAPTSTTPGV